MRTHASTNFHIDRSFKILDQAARLRINLLAADTYLLAFGHWLYGATVARLTPDQKVGSSNLSAVTFIFP